MAKANRAKKETPHLTTQSSFYDAKRWLSEKYSSIMPVQKKYRVIILVVSAIILCTIAAQLLYPGDRGLPLAAVADRSLAFVAPEQMAKVINEQFDASKIKLVVDPAKSVEYPLKSLGAEPNTERMIKTLTNYPLWQRFIPGSIFWQPVRLSKADIFYTNKPLKEFADARAKELRSSPQNARLAIEDGKLVATDAVMGVEITGDELLKTINEASLLLGKTTAVQVPAKRVKAARTSDDLAKVRGEAEATLAHTITINAGDKQFTPDQKELASWIVLSTDDKGDVTLAIDREKIRAYLGEINKSVGVAAGQTDISIVDGREAGRATGATGRAINSDTLADQISVDIRGANKSLTYVAQFIEIQPSVIFNSKYTATQAGLQAYINDTARAKNMRISIRQLDGEGWAADARADESIPSGSTYKLFVALVLFDRIDKGEIHWEDPMLDTTVAGCFERMTVASTNPCAESWIAQFGRQYINDFIHARGFSSGTSFTTGSANQTTANDLTKFMIGLNSGTLVGGANRDRLLDSLGRHPYRYGIPTGSKGIVHDKVGFLWDYVHDTAIVQHPRGAYIMTIMTKGQSYGAIASVTREIERIMYP